MTVTQGAADAAITPLMPGVLITPELGQVEDLTLDQAPALDVRVEQREAGGFLESDSTSLQVMKGLHPLHLWQEPLEVLITKQEAGG